jgi:hypothetical protein
VSYGSSQSHELTIQAAGKETPAMFARRASISQVMLVIALAAANLALGRAMPEGIASFPTVWVFLGLIDFVIVWKLIARRTLRAFHYTFLIVLVIAFLILVTMVATERIHPLGQIVRWYSELTGAKTISISLGYLQIGEAWMALFLSLVLAAATGWVAAWLETRRGWDIAAFFRGALVVLGIFALLATIWEMISGSAQPTPRQLIGRWLIMSACMIVGGIVGLSRLKSKSPSAQQHE